MSGISEARAKVTRLNIAIFVVEMVTFYVACIMSLWPIIDDNPETNGKVGLYALQAVLAILVGWWMLSKLSGRREIATLDLMSARRKARKDWGLIEQEISVPKPPKNDQTKEIADMKEQIDELKEKVEEK